MGLFFGGKGGVLGLSLIALSATAALPPLLSGTSTAGGGGAAVGGPLLSTIVPEDAIGEAVQVEPMKPKLKPTGTKRLKVAK